MAVSRSQRKTSIDRLSRSQSRKVSAWALAFSSDLNQSLRLAKAILPPAGFRELRAHVARVMAALYLDILTPIYRKHPDLKPAGLDVGPATKRRRSTAPKSRR